MLKPSMNSDQILRMAYVKMSLNQLIETRDKLQQQLVVLDQLIAEQLLDKEVPSDECTSLL